MTNKRELALFDFFENYAKRFNQGLENPNGQTEETATAFAPCLIAASPNGVTCGKNDEQFREAIPKGYKFYKSIGITAAEIEAAKVTLMDEFHASVEIKWRFFYTTETLHKFIDFTVIYFVQTLRNESKIFAYITGDEEKVLKEHGLI